MKQELISDEDSSAISSCLEIKEENLHESDNFCKEEQNLHSNEFSENKEEIEELNENLSNIKDNFELVLHNENVEIEKGGFALCKQVIEELDENFEGGNNIEKCTDFLIQGQKIEPEDKEGFSEEPGIPVQPKTENIDPLAEHSYQKDDFQIEKFYDDFVEQEQETSTVNVIDSFYHERSNVKPNQEKNEMACPFCNSFKSSQKFELVEHIDAIHGGEKTFPCQNCDLSFALKSALNSHIQQAHENVKPCVCPICPVSFFTRRGMKKHLGTVHEGIKPYQCLRCAASFKNRQDLRRHGISTHEGVQYKCLICENVLMKFKGSMTKHIKKKHDVPEPTITVHFTVEKSGSMLEIKTKSYKCLICDDVVKKVKRHITKHIRKTHDVPEPTIKVHFAIEKSENEEVSYKCSICENVSMKVKGSMKRHIKKKHDIPEPTIRVHFAIEKSGSTLETHSKKVHESNQTPTCHICCSTFSRDIDLKAHNTMVHGGVFKCLRCNLIKKSRKNMIMHIRIIHKVHKPEIAVDFTNDKSGKLQPAPYVSDPRVLEINPENVSIDSTFHGLIDTSFI